MGMILAVKRSYRYFIPSSLLTPRKLVRQLFTALFFYFIGLTTGMYWYANERDFDRVSKVSIVGLVLLLVLGWWAGVRKDEQASCG
jgi:hypothetical protein